MIGRALENVPLFVTRRDSVGCWVEEFDDGRLFE
jgi:hypothetical protein